MFLDTDLPSEWYVYAMKLRRLASALSLHLTSLAALLLVVSSCQVSRGLRSAHEVLVSDIYQSIDTFKKKCPWRLSSRSSFGPR